MLGRIIPDRHVKSETGEDRQGFFKGRHDHGAALALSSQAATSPNTQWTAKEPRKMSSCESDPAATFEHAPFDNCDSSCMRTWSDGTCHPTPRHAHKSCSLGRLKRRQPRERAAHHAGSDSRLLKLGRAAGTSGCLSPVHSVRYPVLGRFPLRRMAINTGFSTKANEVKASGRVVTTRSLIALMPVSPAPAQGEGDEAKADQKAKSRTSDTASIPELSPNSAEWTELARKDRQRTSSVVEEWALNFFESRIPGVIEAFKSIRVYLQQVASFNSSSLWKASRFLGRLQGVTLDPYPNPALLHCHPLQMQHNGTTTARIRRAWVYALLCYKPSFLRSNLISWGSGFTDSDPISKTILKHFPDLEVLVEQDRTTQGCPAHMLLADHQRQELVVAIRGSSEAADWMINLVFDMSQHGRHEGMMRAAEYLDAKLRPHLDMFFDQHPTGWKLICTGHSLGGGTATLLALRWHNDDKLKADPPLHGYSFGPPCVVEPAISKSCRSYITSIIFGKDIVARLGQRQLQMAIRMMQLICNSIECKDDKHSNLLHYFQGPHSTSKGAGKLNRVSATIRARGLAASTDVPETTIGAELAPSHSEPAVDENDPSNPNTKQKPMLPFTFQLVNTVLEGQSRMLDQRVTARKKMIRQEAQKNRPDWWEWLFSQVQPAPEIFDDRIRSTAITTPGGSSPRSYVDDSESSAERKPWKDWVRISPHSIVGGTKTRPFTDDENSPKFYSAESSSRLDETVDEDEEESCFTPTVTTDAGQQERHQNSALSPERLVKPSTPRSRVARVSRESGGSRQSSQQIPLPGARLPSVASGNEIAPLIASHQWANCFGDELLESARNCPSCYISSVYPMRAGSDRAYNAARITARSLEVSGIQRSFPTRLHQGNATGSPDRSPASVQTPLSGNASPMGLMSQEPQSSPAMLSTGASGMTVPGGIKKRRPRDDSMMSSVFEAMRQRLAAGAKPDDVTRDMSDAQKNEMLRDVWKYVVRKSQQVPAAKCVPAGRVIIVCPKAHLVECDAEPPCGAAEYNQCYWMEADSIQTLTELCSYIPWSFEAVADHYPVKYTFALTPHLLDDDKRSEFDIPTAGLV